MPLSRKLAAEFIGTFWLVFGGCGSAVLAAAFPNNLGIGFAGVALAFGLTVLTMVYAVGAISGGHDGIALRVEDGADRVPHVGLIIDHQNPFSGDMTVHGCSFRSLRS